MKEFVYTLVLVDRLFKEDGWTEKDESIVREHFQNLKELEKQGILLQAGKTAGLDTNTKGFVFFKAESYEKAEEIMNNDPAIKNKIMTGTLQEYVVAIFNKNYTK